MGPRITPSIFFQCLDHFQVVQVLYRFPAMEGPTPYLMRLGDTDWAPSRVTVWPLHLMREGESALDGVQNDAIHFFQSLGHFQVVQVLCGSPAMEASTPYLMRRGGADWSPSSVTVRTSHLSREWDLAPRGGVFPRRG